MEYSQNNVLLFTLGHFGTDWAQGGIPALLPYFIAACHLSYQEAAGIIFANIVLASVTQPLIGYYSDRASLPYLVPLGVFLCGFSLSAMAFTQNYWFILFLAMLSGLGSSLFHPEAARLVNGISGAQKGKAMGTFSVGGNAGFAVGPMAAGFSAYQFGIKGLIIYAVVNFLTALFLMKKLPAIKKRLQGTEKRECPANEPQPKNDWNAFGKLSFVIFARSIGFTILNSFMPIYWISVLGTAASSGSLALSLLFSMGVVMTFLGGILADKVGHIKVMRISFLVMVPALYFLTNSTSQMTATLLLVPTALSLFAPYSPMVILGQTYLARNIGFASGVTLGLSASVGGLISPLVGWAADRWGVGPSLQILWIVAAIGCLFAFLVPVPPSMIKKKA